VKDLLLQPQASVVKPSKAKSSKAAAAKAAKAPAKAGKSGKAAMQSVHVKADTVRQYLGVQRFRFGRAESQDEIGLVTGLAWTEVGGEILNIEATVVPGKGKFQQTGQLGDVMQESIQAALSVVRARSNVMGVDPEFHQNTDIHVHVPEGATPKDGPSAGIAMCTALVSALTKIAVRADIAMTGEITLRGRVLPIGGLKEKLLAALRSGIRHVLIPEENEKDLSEIPDNILSGLKITPVRWIDQVLDLALVEPLKPKVVAVATEAASDPAINKDVRKDPESVRAH
jgi:ATP-dependent Lon protease